MKKKSIKRKKLDKDDWQQSRSWRQEPYKSYSSSKLKMEEIFQKIDDNKNPNVRNKKQKNKNKTRRKKKNNKIKFKFLFNFFFFVSVKC